MKAPLIIILSFIFSLAGAQSLYYKNFELPEKSSMPQLPKEILSAYKGIVLNEHKAKELIITPKDEVEYYFFYNVSILLNHQDAIEKFNKIYIQYQNPADLVIFHCRITHPNGKVTDLYKGDMKQINEEGEDYFILALEGLEENCFAEYYYIKRIGISYTASEVLNPRYYVQNYTSEIISPENIFYAGKSYNGMASSQDTSHSHRNFISVNMKNIEPSPDEKYTLSRAKYPRFEARVDYNTKNSSKKLNTYADVSKTMITNYHAMESGDEKALNRLYKNLKLEKMATADEKIFAIESFIKNECGTYKNNVSLTLSECLEKKGLSEFYQNKLAALLLEKCGIDYEVVSTTYKGEKAFDPEFESYTYLDAAFFYIPSTKKYFMPNEILYRYGDLPSAVTGQKALFIKPIKLGESYSALNKIKDVETLHPNDNFHNMEIDLTFKPSENRASMITKHTVNGYPATSLRPLYFYYDAAKRTELLENVLKNEFKDAKISMTKASNFNVKDMLEMSQPFVFSGMLETREMSEKAGDNYVFKIGSAIGLQSEMYQEGKRKYDIYTAYPHTYKRVVKFKIPAGYTAEGLEKLRILSELKEDGGEVTAHFKSDYTVEGEDVTVVINEVYLKEYYDKKYFEGFRGVINAAADFTKVAILLKKKV